MAAKAKNDMTWVWVLGVVVVVLTVLLLKSMGKTARVERFIEEKRIETSQQLEDAQTDLERTDLNQLDDLLKEVQDAVR